MVQSDEINRDGAAAAIVGVVDDFGLRPVEPPAPPPRIDADDLGVVCWMAVLGRVTEGVGKRE